MATIKTTNNTNLEDDGWDSKPPQPNGGIYPSLNQSIYHVTSGSWAFPISTLSPFSFQFQLSPREFPSEPEAVERQIPVIGYRGWRVTYRIRGKKGRFQKSRAPRLQSVNPEFGVWARSTTKAKCVRKHLAPNYHCECGLYVLANLEAAPKWYAAHGIPADVVVGAVVGWGNVIQHGKEGWRAEFAKPVALLKTDLFGEQPLLDKVAKEYRLPILERRGLQLLASEYGDSLKRLADGR